jgi:hypothetical protein
VLAQMAGDTAVDGVVFEVALELLFARVHGTLEMSV